MFGSIGAPEITVILIVIGVLWFLFRGFIRGYEENISRTPRVQVAAVAADVIVDGLKRCPYCAEEIQAAAIVCKHCGRALAPGVPSASGAPTPSLGVAAVLSLVIPGAGQLYKGQVIGGLLWFVAVIVGYVALIIPGLVLHACCIIGAATSAPRR